MIDTSTRHASIADVARLLDSAHLPEPLRAIVRPYEQLAADLIATLPDGPRLTAALVKLWESKNDAVGHAVITSEAADSSVRSPDVTGRALT